ncbi:hypothetical protein SLEP1_g16061 [Rubroshorea leprosula]|uniref:Uncharacterized protein n=1 Tax=Rubroshorea leprosula TaxID=152421 RepID=A0AAV5J183_9ROSI|nr:hypothetical protein SLEP1_g16061 [Rubroshorea leprosula]
MVFSLFQDRRQALEDENDRLKQEIQQKDKQEQRMKSKLEVVEAENARLKCELEEKKQLTNSLLDVIGIVNQQQMSITNMQPLLTQIKLVVDGFASKVDELQQNITQRSGTPLYAQPWQPQHNISISQVSQAATSTITLTQPEGTSGMQQAFQFPGTFTEDSHGLPDFLLQEQLGQTAQTNDVSPEFGLHQGQGRNTAVESQPLTEGLSDQDAELEEFFSSFFRPKNTPCCFEERGSRVVAASLVAENGPLKPEILEIQELCHEDQQMKSNIEAFEAENKRLKHEIKEKERQMKFNLRAFLVDYGIFEHSMENKKIRALMLKSNNWTLEWKIEEKERLMKSNMEAFEAEKDRLKLEIGEKEQPMKSNLEAFEAQNERLKREIDVKKQLMKSNLEAFEAQSRGLEHEIQAKGQLVKSNLETLEVQIRQLVDEFEYLNVANVSVNRSTQTQSGS